MSRFPEASITCLKGIMLTRAPEFFFKPEDESIIVRETGLNAAQISKWSENFRMRYESTQERMDFLSSDGSEKEKSVKVSRYYVSCFNVSLEFASTFKFGKAKGVSDFNIKYMEAAFDKEAGSGEFFIEFEEKVWEHKLIESFKIQGAGQVSVVTFANNDAGDSASNALLRVFTTQERSNLKYSRGVCPPSLLAKVQAKQAAAKSSSSKEFDEKTMLAIKQSLALQEETKAAVVKVEDSLQSQGAKLDGIEHGVCNVIPDYQKEIEQLKAGLAHKTALCDKIEGQKAYKTRLINQQDVVIAKLEADQCNHVKEKQAWAHREAALLEQIDLCNSVSQAKQMLEAANKEREILTVHVELLISIINEERASKRARAI